MCRSITTNVSRIREGYEAEHLRWVAFFYTLLAAVFLIDFEYFRK